MPDIVAELTKLNEEFATAELEMDRSFFERHLADGVKFRRASGKVVEKGAFLEDLAAPANTNERVEPKQIEVLPYGADLAVCSMLIDFKGTRAGKPAEGLYRNTRVFVRSAAGWQCALWFNTAEPQSTSAAFRTVQ